MKFIKFQKFNIRPFNILKLRNTKKLPLKVTKKYKKTFEIPVVFSLTKVATFTLETFLKMNSFIDIFQGFDLNYLLWFIIFRTAIFYTTLNVCF